MSCSLEFRVLFRQDSRNFLYEIMPQVDNSVWNAYRLWTKAWEMAQLIKRLLGNTKTRVGIF